jgi:hypothetical protein
VEERQGLFQLAFAHKLLALFYELWLLLLLALGLGRLRGKSGGEDQDDQGTTSYAVHGQSLSHCGV